MGQICLFSSRHWRCIRAISRLISIISAE